MADKRICLGCEVEGAHIHMFKGSFYDENEDEYVEEVYCNECIANIMTEDPSIVSNMEAI